MWMLPPVNLRDKVVVKSRIPAGLVLALPVAMAGAARGAWLERKEFKQREAALRAVNVGMPVAEGADERHGVKAGVAAGVAAAAFLAGAKTGPEARFATGLARLYVYDSIVQNDQMLRQKFRTESAGREPESYQDWTDLVGGLTPREREDLDRREAIARATAAEVGIPGAKLRMANAASQGAGLVASYVAGKEAGRAAMQSRTKHKAAKKQNRKTG
jgi:hypothetical protein